MSTLLVYRQIIHKGRCHCLFLWPGIRCTYFLVTGLRVHLGCRSGAAAEGWSSEQEGVDRGFGCSTIWTRTVRGETGGSLFWGGGAIFSHLYSECSGYIGTPIPASSSVSFQFMSAAASTAPWASSPPKQIRNTAGAFCVSPSLWVGLLLPCIQGLGSLSLPFPPPPLPACDPTLRPHPSSLCQSAELQPCRGAEPSPTEPDRADQGPLHNPLQMRRGKGDNACNVQLMQRLNSMQRPCHLTDVMPRANWGRSWVRRVWTHPTKASPLTDKHSYRRQNSDKRQIFLNIKVTRWINKMIKLEIHKSHYISVWKFRLRLFYIFCFCFYV